MDKRDFVNISGKWYNSFNEEKMLVVINEFGDDCEQLEVPISFKVCGTCNGKGKHINPSIDAHGISGEEFHNDPQFAEDYFGGVYDVACYECKGKRVVPKFDYDVCVFKHGKEIAEQVRNYIRDFYKDIWERAREIEMGY